MPVRAEQLDLLMRGRLPEFLKYVEAYSGGGRNAASAYGGGGSRGRIENGGNWRNNGELLSPKLEELAREVRVCACMCVCHAPCVFNTSMCM